MSITFALGKLLTKMGGTPSAGDNSDELISKIADVYAPDGGGWLVINKVYNEEDHEYHANKTTREILAAMPRIIFEDKFTDGVTGIIDTYAYKFYNFIDAPEGDSWHGVPVNGVGFIFDGMDSYCFAGSRDSLDDYPVLYQEQEI